MKLLCVVGRSPLVLPEAWFFDRNRISSVHAISTDIKEPRFDEVVEFFKRKNIVFKLSRVSGIETPSSTYLNEQFEEVLLRWAFLEARDEKEKPYFCLSGGTNTMVASMFKAANIVGSSEVFQVMIKDHPQNINEVIKADSEKKLEYARMGKTLGWSTLEHMESHFQLIVTKGKKSYLDILHLPNDLKFRDYIQHVTDKTFYSKGTKSARLPFSKLELLPKTHMSWLEQPLRKEDRLWISFLPKVELHCHLGGFATKGTLLNIVRGSAYKPDLLPDVESFSTPDGWPRPSSTIDLREYMRLGDNTGSSILMDEGCLRKHLDLLYEYFVNENIIYGELRCSPQNYAKKMGKSSQYVLDIIKDQLTKARKLQLQHSEFAPAINLIIIATRKKEGDLSDISRHLALAIVNKQESIISDPNTPQIVGVDLAGYESKETRASYYQADFIGIHRCGIAVTAHAGENDDAEGIWQAVYSLHTRRLGHALRLEEAPDLKRAIIERNIGIEMCPYANYQIKGFAPMMENGKPLKKYPLLDYIHAGVKASVNTDNIGISEASLTDNFLFLIDLCPGIKRLDILQLIRNALDTSFISYEERLALLNQMEERILKTCLTKISLDYE